MGCGKSLPPHPPNSRHRAGRGGVEGGYRPGLALPCVFPQARLILFHMFRTIKSLVRELARIADLVEGLIHSVHGLIQGDAEAGKLAERIDALERRVGLIVADAEAKLASAEGKLKAARASEERERRLAETRARNAEGDDDLSAEAIREAYAAAGLDFDDDGRSRENGVPAVPTHVDARREGKAAAIAAKWNR